MTIQNVQGHFDNGHYKGYAYGLFNGNDVVYEIEAYYIGDSVVHNFALTKESAKKIKQIKLVKEKKEKDRKIKAFIKDMFNERKYENDVFLRKHCTKKLLKFLNDKYEYDKNKYEFDDDGESESKECYASWHFGLGWYEVDEGDKFGIEEINKLSDEWYSYTFYDMGVKGKNKIKLYFDKDVIMIDGLEHCYVEYCSSIRGYWTKYMEYEGKKVKVMTVYIDPNVLADYRAAVITYPNNGAQRNVVKFKKVVFKDGMVYLSDNGSFGEGSPRFQLGYEKLKWVDGTEMEKDEELEFEMEMKQSLKDYVNSYIESNESDLPKIPSVESLYGFTKVSNIKYRVNYKRPSGGGYYEICVDFTIMDPVTPKVDGFKITSSWYPDYSNSSSSLRKVRCPICKGQGKVSLNNMGMYPENCPKCGGNGYIYEP